MSRRAAAVCVLALALLAGAARAREADPFYLDLLREGIAELARGESSDAAESLQIACFGLLEEPKLLAEGLTHLGLAQAKLNDGKAFRATFERLAAIEARFHAYSESALDPATRAAFAEQAAALVPPAELAATPAFAEIAEARVRRELEKLAPRQRRKEIDRRLKTAPGDPLLLAMLAELDPAARRKAPVAAPATPPAPAVTPTRPAPPAANPTTPGSSTAAPGTPAPPTVSPTAPAPPAVKPTTPVSSAAAPPTPAPPAAAPATPSAPPTTATQEPPVATAPRTATAAPAKPGTTPPKPASPVTPPVSPPAATRPPAPPAPPPAGASGAPRQTAPATGAPPSTPPAPAAPVPPAAAPPAAPPPAVLSVPDAARLAEARDLLARARVSAELDQASTLARQVADANPKSAEAQLLAGEIAYRGSRFAEAARYLMAAGEAIQRKPTLLFYLAVAQYETGDREAARRSLEGSLKRIQRTPFVDRYVQKITGAPASP